MIKPINGSQLTLAQDYWFGDNRKGNKVVVVKSRHDKEYRGGIKIYVQMNGVTKPQWLSCKWFMEYGG